MSSVEATWRLIGYSSAISIAGSLVIYLDLIWNSIFSRKINILKSRSFMVASLAISGGVLLTTAMHSLLDNAIKYFRKSDLSKQQASQVLLAAVVTGIVICSVANFLIHLATSKSIVHCAHGGDHSASHEHHDHSDGHHGHGHAHSHEHPQVEQSEVHQHTHHCGDISTESNEETLLLDRSVRQYIAVENLNLAETSVIKPSLIDKLKNTQHTGECRGFQSIYHCAAEIALLANPQAEEDVSLVLGEDPEIGHVHEHQAGDEPHHHHVIPRGSELLSIGLQTAFAITIHKLPEGFLVFATGRHDKQVGLNVFFALAIHNFFEGFTIAAPLYLALQSRFKAVLYASVLSAGSQPLGALVAQYTLSGKLQKNNFLLFGVLIGATSGFMIIIGLQMLTTAVSYGGQPHRTVIWAVAGIIMVLVSKCF